MGQLRPSVISTIGWRVPVVVSVLVQAVAVAALLAGPWTDEPAELAGWDAERFQQIAERDGAAWVDQPVEYPPGSVVVLDRLAGEDVVDTNRNLVMASAAVEVLGVIVLWRAVGPAAAGAFLLLGLPLIPMGLMRLDMIVTVVAMVAAVVLLTGGGRRSAALFAGLVAVGAMIKIWPALLVAGAWAIGRRAAAAAAAGLTGLLGLIWLAAVGAGIDPVQQVLSLRGATGWHVESVPGAFSALVSGAEPRLELNAYRIGSLDRTVVSFGRVTALVLIAALTTFAVRAGPDQRRERLALVVLGSTAALIVTAPLLSPQFLLWLTPWGAMLLAGERGWHVHRPALGLLIVGLVLTGGTLALFGPANLADRLPALLLTARNAALLALPLACLVTLRGGFTGPVGRDRR